MLWNLPSILQLKGGDDVDVTVTLLRTVCVCVAKIFPVLAFLVMIVDVVMLFLVMSMVLLFVILVNK